MNSSRPYTHDTVLADIPIHTFKKCIPVAKSRLKRVPKMLNYYR